MENVAPPVVGETMSRAAQSAWMQSLRRETAHIEFVFNNGDGDHPLIGALANLESSRRVGVGPGNGYARPRRAAVKRRYAYSRDIIFALDDLGCFFPDATSKEQWTGLGDVDVVFLDHSGKVLGATVTHEAMIITPGYSDDPKKAIPSEKGPRHR